MGHPPPIFGIAGDYPQVGVWANNAGKLKVECLQMAPLVHAKGFQCGCSSNQHEKLLPVFLFPICLQEVNAIWLNQPGESEIKLIMVAWIE